MTRLQDRVNLARANALARTSRSLSYVRAVALSARIHNGIYVMGADGTGVTNLTKPPAYRLTP